MTPTVIGGLCLHPPGVPGRPGMRNLVLECGRAFGQGDHATTVLILLEAEEMARSRPLGRVLDLGTGTGVVAMAAIQLGATEVVACDIDVASVAEARRNAARNGIGGVTFVEGSFEACLGRFDTILANVTTEVHLGLSGDYTGKLAPGGRVRLGGVRADETASVERVTGTEVARRLDGWTILRYPGESTMAPPPQFSEQGVAVAAPRR